MSKPWKKIKRSGHFNRSLKRDLNQFQQRVWKLRSEIEERSGISNEPSKSISSVSHQKVEMHAVVEQSNALTSNSENATSGNNNYIFSEKSENNGFSFISDDANSDEDEITTKQNLRLNLRKWASKYNISHLALKDIIKIFNETFGKSSLSLVLPEDPRTLMQTPQTVKVLKLSDGEYWHHGLGNCLQKLFRNLKEPIKISININIDGLPIYASSKIEFWPILFNIAEMPQVPAMIIGIFCGKTKTCDVETFFTPFVKELSDITKNGVYIISQKITVNIRCFICDSPARAYVKGVANFNSHHGCLKCTTIGEYSYISHTNIFPRTDCIKRTNDMFRQNSYGLHQKSHSPLLNLNIDMIEQFPVGDSLHLLHLGIMKRLLLGWRDGSFRTSQTKWPANTTEKVSEYLIQCKMPAEFHRVVRGLECLSYWKGTEYRTFLHYIGIVALKDHLPIKAYENFLVLFCAVTICSSKRYFYLLPLARTLFNEYIKIFREIYGEEYLTSNVHNLTHVVDEVERFGELESFSAYPFENMLGKIKRLLRNGNRPLVQVSKRIIEGLNCNYAASEDEILQCKIPAASQSQKAVLSKRNDGQNIPTELIGLHSGQREFYSKIELDHYCMSTDPANCWFLSNKNVICRLVNIFFQGKNYIKLCCISSQEKHDFFSNPIKSSYLNIYCCNSNIHKHNYFNTKILNLHDINCKLVCLKHKEINVFIPLMHTI